MNFSSMLNEIEQGYLKKEQEKEQKIQNKADILLPFYDKIWELFREINNRLEKNCFQFYELNRREIEKNGRTSVLVIFWGNFSKTFYFDINEDYIPTLAIGCVGEKHDYNAIGLDDSIAIILDFVKKRLVRSMVK